MQVSGVTQDFGTLSAKSIVTGNDGRRRRIFTAPPAPPAPSTNSGTQVSILATTTGTNFDTAQSQSVEIRLCPPGVILPPADTPTPKFSFSPTAPTANQPTLFDASASCAGSSACTSTAGITNFAWNFGDGSSGSGVTPSHTFKLNGTFNVTLTVTNTGGVQASTSQAVPVGAGNGRQRTSCSRRRRRRSTRRSTSTPSQSRPAAGAQRSSATPGTSATARRRPASRRLTPSHRPARFNVTLTVTDEVGQAATSPGRASGRRRRGRRLTSDATFTFSPTSPVVGHTVFFNTSGSTAPDGHTSTTATPGHFGDGSSYPRLRPTRALGEPPNPTPTRGHLTRCS